MQTILKWVVGAALGWLLDLLKDEWAKYQERKRKARETREANAQAEQRLQEAESEQEVIDAGSDHLKR